MRRAAGIVLGIALALAAGCGDNDPPCAPATSAFALGAAPCATAPCTDLFVVAHEDDDLLFMNPEVYGSIRRGDRVIALYVTAGDLGQPGNDQYWIDRERGELEAYAYMAGAPALPAYAPPPVIPAGWRVAGGAGQTIELGGLAATEYDLATAPVSLVFLRLGDYQEACLWEQTTGCSGENPEGDQLPYRAITEACAGAGRSPACPAPASIPVQHVTRAELVAAIAAAITRFGVDSLDALDATHLHFDALGGASRTGWTEYPDHYYSAMFALAAAGVAQAGAPRRLAIGLHQGYTIVRAGEDVAPGPACATAAAFARYAMFDDQIVHHPTPDDFPACLDCEVGGAYRLSDPESWQRRAYAARTRPPTSGVLASGQTCLGARGPAVAAVPCAEAPAWTSTVRNQLALGDRCLTAGEDGALALAPCDRGRADQVMFVFDDGQIRTPGAGCLTWDGGRLTSAACAADIGPDGHVTDRTPAAQAFTLGRAP